MSSPINSTIMAAAIGATAAFVTVAASMIYTIIQKRHEQQQEHTLMQNKIQNLNNVVAMLQEEVDQLLELQKKQKTKRRFRRRVQPNGSSGLANDIDTDLETFSNADTDVGDDEFYDCSDLEEDSETLNGVNGAQDTLYLTLTKIDEIAEDESQRQYVYDTMKRLFETHPGNVEVVWRYARACYEIFTHETDVKVKKQILEEGLNACENLLEINHMNLYKWYAILIGSRSQLMPPKEKIANAYRYKEYVEKALNLEPTNSLLLHLLGRFKYEVSKLSWFERKIAATLFGEPPSGTYEEAMQYFKDADKLAKEPHLENKLFMSKCYISLNRKQEASECLRSLLEIDVTSDKDRKIQQEAQVLLHDCET